MTAVILVAGNTVPAIAARRGDFDRWIREQTGDAWRGSWAAHDVRTTAPLPGPRDADAFVITGSSSSVTERAPWMLRAEELVREIARRGRAAARHLLRPPDDRAGARRRGHAEPARPRDRHACASTACADDPIFAGLPRTFDVHGDARRLRRPLCPRAHDAGDDLARSRRRLPRRPPREGRAVSPRVRRRRDRAATSHARAEIIRSEGKDPEAFLARVHDGTRGRDILRNFAALRHARGLLTIYSRWPWPRDHLVLFGPGASAATTGSGAKSCGSTDGRRQGLGRGRPLLSGGSAVGVAAAAEADEVVREPRVVAVGLRPALAAHVAPGAALERRPTSTSRAAGRRSRPTRRRCPACRRRRSRSCRSPSSRSGRSGRGARAP